MVAIKNFTITSALVLGVAEQAFAAPIITSNSLEARTPEDDLTLRAIDEIDERDIDERSPRRGNAIIPVAINAPTRVGTAWAKNRGRRDLEDLTERDIMELYDRGFALDERDIDERSPRGGKAIIHHAIKAATRVGTAWAKNRGRRDLEDLTERDIMELYEREFALDEREIDERSPKGRGGGGKGIFHHAINAATRIGTAWAKNRGRRDVDEIATRQVEELDERDIDERSPKGRGGGGKGIFHHAINAATRIGTAWAKNRGRRDLEDLTERDILELYERGFTLDEREIDERSPKGRSGYNSVNPNHSHGRRDLDTYELVARALEELDERDLEYIYTRYLEDVEAIEN